MLCTTVQIAKKTLIVIRRIIIIISLVLFKINIEGYLLFFLFFFFLFLRESERPRKRACTHDQGKGQRERKNLKHAPHSTQSLKWIS